MKGRKPDPEAAAHGTSHHGAKTAVLAPVEYTGAVTVANAAEWPLPAAMPRSKVAKALWQGLVCEVARHELRTGDLPLAQACCVAAWRWREAGLFVKKWGPMVKDNFGGVKPNPMLGEERAQAILYDRLAQRLGLSPEARVRLNLMQIAGATLLGSLRKSIEDAVDEEIDDVVDAEAIEVE